MNFGSRRIQAALLLQEACLHSSMLFCAEVWFPLTIAYISKLEKVDVYFKRKILKAQVKTPSISLYLELGCLKLRHVILMKRVMYFHCLIKKDINDLTYKILMKQEQDSVKGDFIELIRSDFKYFGLDYDLNKLRNLCKIEFKAMLKKSIFDVAFKEYLNEKRNMKKLKNINYSKFKLQSYLQSNHLTDYQKQVIFSLRTYTFKVRMNLRRLHLNNLLCRLCHNCDETQEHIFTQCSEIEGKILTQEYISIFRESEIKLDTARCIGKIANIWNVHLDNFKE